MSSKPGVRARAQRCGTQPTRLDVSSCLQERGGTKRFSPTSFQNHTPTERSRRLAQSLRTLITRESVWWCGGNSGGSAEVLLSDTVHPTPCILHHRANAGCKPAVGCAASVSAGAKAQKLQQLPSSTNGIAMAAAQCRICMPCIASNCREPGRKCEWSNLLEHRTLAGTAVPGLCRHRCFDKILRGWAACSSQLHACRPMLADHFHRLTSRWIVGWIKFRSCTCCSLLLRCSCACSLRLFQPVGLGPAVLALPAPRLQPIHRGVLALEVRSRLGGAAVAAPLVRHHDAGLRDPLTVVRLRTTTCVWARPC